MLFYFYTGLGHYQSIGQASQVKGAIEGEKIVQIACSGDCVLALSGEFVSSTTLFSNFFFLFFMNDHKY